MPPTIRVKTEGVNGFDAYIDDRADAVVQAALEPVDSRAALLASTGLLVRWDSDEGGLFRLSTDQVSATDNVFRIERDDETIVERIWDGVNFYAEWVPLGIQVGSWGVTNASINGDKLTAAASVIPAGATLHLKPKETYNVDLPMRILGDIRIEGHNATIKRASQRSSLLTANSNAGTSTVTVADASVFRVGMRAFVVKTSGVLGGHAMVNGSSVLYGSSGFLIMNINGNVITLGGTLQQNCVVGNKLVALDSLILSDNSTAKFVCADLTFDGNKSQHADVLDWAAGYGISVMGGWFERCKFINMPNENVTISYGEVRNCEAVNLNGSFLHPSSADGSDTKGILVENCFTTNTNTTNNGHSEGVVAFSNNGRNIRVINCVFDNSTGAKGDGVFGVLDAASDTNRDDNFLASNVVAKNFKSIVTLSLSGGTKNFSRFILKECTFERCGSMLVQGADVTNGPCVNEVKIDSCHFVNCWMDFRHIRYLTLADNSYQWDLYDGVFAGIAGAVVNLPTTRIGGSALAEGDASAAVLAGAANGIYIRTGGSWVKDETASSDLPTSSIVAGVAIWDCGFVDIHGGYYAGPGFKVNNTFNVGIWLNATVLRKTEAGTTDTYYMDVSIDDVHVTGFQIGISNRNTDDWTTTSPTYDVASWVFSNVTVVTMRCNIYFNTLGMEVPGGGGIAKHCNVFLSDTSTLNTSIGIKLNGPVDATKSVGGAAIGCYVPHAPGSSTPIRLGRNADNARNKNCIAVGNVIAKSVALAGSHDSVQDNNTVISLSGMTSPTVPPWRPVGANESLY